MVDIPIGKALIAVESDIECNFECMDETYHCPLTDQCCRGCVMEETDELISRLDDETCGCLACNPGFRKDKKKIVYKLVDYPVKK